MDEMFVHGADRLAALVQARRCDALPIARRSDCMPEAVALLSPARANRITIRADFHLSAFMRTADGRLFPAKFFMVAADAMCGMVESLFPS